MPVIVVEYVIRGRRENKGTQETLHCGSDRKTAEDKFEGLKKFSKHYVELTLEETTRVVVRKATLVAEFKEV